MYIFIFDVYRSFTEGTITVFGAVEVRINALLCLLCMYVLCQTNILQPQYEHTRHIFIRPMAILCMKQLDCLIWRIYGNSSGNTVWYENLNPQRSCDNLNDSYTFYYFQYIFTNT